MVTYADEHWLELAALVNEGLTVGQIQDRYPWATEATVARWIRRCRTRGLIA